MSSSKKQHSHFSSSAWCLLACMMPSLCQAEIQDPTKPGYPNATASSYNNATAQKKLVLSAIWITASGKWATINGVTAKEGQTILNKVKIIKISRNSVSLNYNGSLKKLHLLHSLQSQ